MSSIGKFLLGKEKISYENFDPIVSMFGLGRNRLCPFRILVPKITASSHSLMFESVH